MSNNNANDKSSENLRTFMRFRKQTARELSEHTGISQKTIEDYAQGRIPFCNASAVKFLAITDYLEIDPHYMLGKEEWDLREYILKEFELESLSGVKNLSETSRLTLNTRKHRKNKRKLGKYRREAIKLFKRGYVIEHPQREIIKIIKFQKDEMFVFEAKRRENKPPKLIRVNSYKKNHELTEDYVDYLSECIRFVDENGNPSK